MRTPSAAAACTRFHHGYRATIIGDLSVNEMQNTMVWQFCYTQTIVFFLDLIMKTIDCAAKLHAKWCEFLHLVHLAPGRRSGLDG